MSLHCDGWCQLNNVTFRKSLLYERMKWSNAAESNSRNSLFCSAQFGGPVAIAYTHDASLKVQRSFPIVTYTASGQQIGKIQWQNGELLDIFWSNAEDLLCLQKDGRVFVYSMFGLEKRNRQFGMGNVSTFVLLICVE
uniref:Vps16 N-terminal domain-containing protein n=2 Tax=Plectus sambesii TaxID=2011161 RepID=A0A914XQJ5_9BILA